MSHNTHSVHKLSVEPYQQIAGFYDHLMNHVDYSGWASYIEDCFNAFGQNIQSVLDGGCGTGSLMVELKNRGYQISGFDLSFEMIQLARSKGLSLTWQGDLCSPAIQKEWDSIICLYDTVHYLSEQEIQVFFRNMFRLLKPEGLFVFDAVTERHVKTYWANYTEKGEVNGCQFLRRSWYNAEEKRQYTEFDISITPGKLLFHERHVQYIHPIPFFLDQAEAIGFSVLGVFDECTFVDGHTHSDRIHVVLSRS